MQTRASYNSVEERAASPVNQADLTGGMSVTSDGVFKGERRRNMSMLMDGENDAAGLNNFKKYMKDLTDKVSGTPARNHIQEVIN